MEVVIIMVVLVAAILLCGCLILLLQMRKATADKQRDLQGLTDMLTQLSDVVSAMRQAEAVADAAEQQRHEALARQLAQQTAQVDALRRETLQQLGANRDSVDTRLETVRQSVEAQLASIRSDNARQLEQMRMTVDEKLSRTLNDRLSSSFKQVSEQLEAVYRGLGDMQSIAAGVGDLKRVLGNVKTRGILGEVQLEAILSEILAPGQYEKNIATKPGSNERVEFAVKLPVEEGEPVLLPIDSKFPGDAYEHLRDAQDSGDAEAVSNARKVLEIRIKAEAKDIRDKYLSVPQTTNFGIMFLPFEGLYAEVVSSPGLVETLSREYRVNVAGPSTMAALLNSLQMSYQTFRLQKQTDDVLRVLTAVKAELPRYQDALRQARRQIDTAGRTVDSIITTRTNVIERKLDAIGSAEMGSDEAAALLGFSDELVQGGADVPLDGGSGAAARAGSEAASGTVSVTSDTRHAAISELLQETGAHATRGADA